jgi:hypothetical protein
VIALCKEYGIKLKPATDQDNEEYTTPSGKRYNGEIFANAASEIQQRIINDKNLIAKNPEGELAKKLDSMSLADYLQTIEKAEMDSQQAASVLSRTGAYFKKAYNAVMPGRHNIDTAEVIATIKGLYTAEAGRNAENISALQFVNEMSNQPGQFLASDCAYRVEGGTERIIQALRQDLEKKGVAFHQGEAAAIDKDGKGLSVTFKDGTVKNTDKVMLALPTKAISRISGLDALGLSQESSDTLSNAQYTHSTKFSIATKGDGKDSCLYSSEGFQAWRSEPGVMTFLVGGETMNQKKGSELVKQCLESYAKAQGSTVDKLFDTSKIADSGVNPNAPCYMSPAPGQSLKLAALSREVDLLAEQGVAVAGTFIPQRTPGNASIGFMECGVQSASRAVDILLDQEISLNQTQWQGKVKTERGTGHQRPANTLS